MIRNELLEGVMLDLKLVFCSFPRGGRDMRQGCNPKTPERVKAQNNPKHLNPE
jgi:nucleoid DNA-binding protein